MLTIFACPKPFTDPHIATIQRNAIRSWMLMKPKPDIILFGDEEGVVDVCHEFGLLYVPKVGRSEFGTPLLNDVFEQAERLSSTPLLCYVNADIILISDFMRAVAIASAAKERFMMGGRRWDVELPEALDFSGNWEERVRCIALRYGALRSIHSCDYFVFSRGLWGVLPPLVLGRCFFDNALMRLSRKRRGALIDATQAVTAVHPNHNYAAGLGGEEYCSNPEARWNEQFAGGPGCWWVWHDASHLLRRDQVRVNLTGYFNLWRMRKRTVQLWRQWLWFPFLNMTRPLRTKLGLRKKRPA